MAVPGPFGGYTNGTQTVSGAAKAEIAANIAKLKALVPNPAAGVKAASPDFDQIHPRTALQLRVEIDAMAAAIAAAP